MIGLSVGPTGSPPHKSGFQPPAGLGWAAAPTALNARATQGGYAVDISPRLLVDQSIWTGAAIHVDGAGGNDSNTGLGAQDGDFSDAKRTIHAAFTAGNATSASYRVIVKAGKYAGSAFTKNGQVEPDQPVAIIGWGGEVHYRTGNHSYTWTDVGGTYTASISSTNRLFRTDVLTGNGLYTELSLAADLVTCEGTVGTWFKDGSTLHVNIGKAPTPTDIAAMRNFNGARFLNHSEDIYLENIRCEGGITGGLHCCAVASRTIIGVNSSFRYSSPSNVSSPQDAVRICRTDGLVAFFDCDASGGAKDGWNFHDDNNPQMFVLLVNCTGFENGALGAVSCNGFTTHETVISAVIGGQFGYSRNGTEAHCVENAKTWFLGTEVVARDPDGSCVAFKMSNNVQAWLENTTADAAGGVSENFALVANGGTIHHRGHSTIAGGNDAYSGGVIVGF